MSCRRANSFDPDITYSKGEALLRMLEAYLGEDVFRDGIRNYMKSRAYSNAAAADLWNALSRRAARTSPRSRRRWTEKPGFPLVGGCGLRFVRQSQRDLGPERFLLKGGSAAGGAKARSGRCP